MVAIFNKCLPVKKSRDPQSFHSGKQYSIALVCIYNKGVRNCQASNKSAKYYKT